MSTYLNQQPNIFSNHPISSELTKQELSRRWINETAAQAVSEALRIFDAGVATDTGCAPGNSSGVETKKARIHGFR